MNNTLEKHRYGNRYASWFIPQKLLEVVLLSACFIQCSSQPVREENSIPPETEGLTHITNYDTLTKTIHVLVALCDNTYQGIVPVPAKIGNGQDPYNNLYWGCAYGIKTFFKKSSEWVLVKTQKKDSILLERLVFKHVSKNYYLVADAYNGKYIKTCTEDFLSACAGQYKDTLHINKTRIGIRGNARLIAYIGHDGLMDFQMEKTVKNADYKTRDCIILACLSRNYFSAQIKATQANPLVWTTGLMCPEAYTLHDALTGYVNNESDEAICSRAALAYAAYQKCSEKAARKLLVTGF
jgi:hypothetical protein